MRAKTYGSCSRHAETGPSEMMKSRETAFIFGEKWVITKMSLTEDVSGYRCFS